MSLTSTASSDPLPKVRMLFVDDETAVLKVLQAAMRSMAAEWEMHFAENGEDALALIQKLPFDAVISDMRMPGMNGAQLLNHVLKLCPGSLRIILSGYSDLQDVISCVGLVHQFLNKPCKLADLRTSLKRATQLKQQLQHEELRALTARLTNVPSMPALYIEMLDALQSPTASTQRIADIASQDPALCAKLLQLSNSTCFGFSRTVYSVAEAVQLLGVGLIQSLALAVPLFSSFDQRKCPTFPLDEVWDHCVQTGALARRLVKQHLDNSLLAEQAFAAGLLHDIGKLMLADSMPKEYTALLAEARSQSQPLCKLEAKSWQVTHAEIGGCLLALWGLPFPLVEAVANHHQPSRSQGAGFGLTGFIHVANSLQHELAGNPGIVPGPMDMNYLHSSGMTSLVEQWRSDLRDGAVE
jgi:HD-like signal output (HDOD) protein